MRSHAEGVLQFLRSHEKLWPLVLPKASVETVLRKKRGTSWTDVAEEVAKICQASPLGERLFEFGLVEVCEAVCKSRIDAIIKTLGTATVLDEAAVRKTRNEAKDSLKTVTGIGGMPDRREIEVDYRGWKLQLPVRSLEEEVQVRVSCAVRGWISGMGTVKTLPGETELCAIDEKVKFDKIDFELSGPMDASRKELHLLLSAMTVQSGEGLKDRDGRA
eukprot:6164659-Amphidinium_carterae.1